MRIQPLVDLWDRGFFPTGLWWGIGALGIGVAIAAAYRGRRQVPVGGQLLVAASVLGLAVEGLLPRSLLGGLVLLLIGGAASRRMGNPGRMLMAVPGAVVLASAVPDRAGWVRPLVVAVTVLGGQLVSEFDRRHGRLSCVLVAFSAAGVYFTVPDTEQAAVLFGAALPLALLGWPITSATLGRAGSVAVTGLLAWTAATGGRGRESAVVGGIACLGLLAAEPLSRRIGNPGLPALFRRRAPADAVTAGSVHLGMVYVASRIAGLRPRLLQAVFVVIVELLGVLLLDVTLPSARHQEVNR